MNEQVIPAEAVEAAARELEMEDGHTISYSRYQKMARLALEAASPHMMAGVEWAIFRASDGQDGTPMENLRYTSREAAQKWINDGFRQPEFWEVRGRAVGTWQK